MISFSLILFWLPSLPVKEFWQMCTNALDAHWLLEPYNLIGCRRLRRWKLIMKNTQGSRLSWEVAGYSESIHMWVLTFDITIFYAYQPKYITDHGFKGYFLYFTTWALFYHLLTSKWVVKFLVFKIAPVGSYGPAKMRSSSHIPSKVNGSPLEVSKYKSNSVVSLILTLLKFEKNI